VRTARSLDRSEPIRVAPWAFEAPSAGRPLTWSTLFDSSARIGWQFDHAAGIVDRLERLDRDSLNELCGGRRDRGVIRRAGQRAASSRSERRSCALRSAAIARGAHSSPRARPASSSARVSPSIVDGILSGMHSRGTSHYSLLRAFAPEALLDRTLARGEGYRARFGDSCLILPKDQRTRMRLVVADVVVGLRLRTSARREPAAGRCKSWRPKTASGGGNPRRDV
jgi:S-adenosylmethionine:tRNA ribosyltransferase-isomerase